MNDWLLCWASITKQKQSTTVLWWKDKIRSSGDTVVCIIAQPHERCSRVTLLLASTICSNELIWSGKRMLPFSIHTYICTRTCAAVWIVYVTLGAASFFTRLWWKGVGVSAVPDGYSFRRSTTTALLADTRWLMTI